MTPNDARSALKWALTNPDKAKSAGSALWTELADIIPQALATAGTYAVAELVSRRFGLQNRMKPPVSMAPLSLETAIQAGGQETA